MTERRTIALTGATGSIGRVLAPLLVRDGHDLRCLSRDPAKLEGTPGRAVRGDVVTGDGLAEFLAGADVAYYLVHSMEAGADEGFEERDRAAARTFAEAAAAAGVGRIVYLGGLESRSASPSAHLASRDEVARVLGTTGVPVVHARAAMVIGASSASFAMLAALVRRLPAMIGPRWIDTRTQPIAIADVAEALAALATIEPVPDEVQLGGADIVTYHEMMRRFAVLDGRRPRPVLRVPFLTPRLSSYWVGFVTPVEPALAQPLVEGLGSEMIVTTPPPPGINDHPLGFDDAVRVALEEERR